MIHLFKKIYLTFDSLVDYDRCHVVVGDKFGEAMRMAAQNNSTKMIAAADDHENIVEIFQTLLQQDQQVIVYASQQHFVDILLIWLANLLRSADAKTLWILARALIFRHVVFSNNRFNRGIRDTTSGYNLTLDHVARSLQANRSCKLDTTIFEDHVSVEFLLASYLYDARGRRPLKHSIAKLVRKDMVKYLYELKEIFLIHLMTRSFTKDLRLTKQYTIEDFENTVDDQSDFARLFTTNRIWKDALTTAGSDPDSINLNAITSEDVQLFKEFTVLAGQRWQEEGNYIYIKSDINKLDFLPIFNHFTDEMLDHLIETESTFDHAAGSFFSIDLSTVNHYLITHILDHRQDKVELKKYTIGHS